MVMSEPRSWAERRAADQRQRYPELDLADPVMVSRVDARRVQRGELPSQMTQDTTKIAADIARAKAGDRSGGGFLSGLADLWRQPTGTQRRALGEIGATPRQVEAYQTIAQQEMQQRAPRTGVNPAQFALGAAGVVGSMVDSAIGAPLRGQVLGVEEMFRTGDVTAPGRRARQAILRPETARGVDLPGIRNVPDPDIIGGVGPRDVLGFGAEALLDVGVGSSLLRGGGRAVARSGVRQLDEPIDAATRGILRDAPGTPGAVQRATDVPFRPRIMGGADGPIADVQPFRVQGSPTYTPDEVFRAAQSDAARLYAATAKKAEEPVYGGVVDALEQAAAAVRTDPQGVVSRLAGRIPGLRAVRDWDRPGLVMEKRLLEGHIARRGVENQLTTGQSPARFDSLRNMDDVFGPEASSGGRVVDDLRVDVDTLHRVGDVEYPGSGTVYDFLQRPYAYADPGGDAAEAITQWAKTDEGMRALVNERFGTEIGHFVSERGGVYVANVNVSEARQATLDNLARTEALAVTGSGKSKPRVWESGFDRWANDLKRAEQGIIKPDAVFVPETDLRVLGYTSDLTKARAAGNMTLRGATGGRTISEVKELVAPDLVQLRDGLRQEITSIAGRIQRATQSARRDSAVARRLDQMADSTSRRAEQIAERLARAEGRAAETVPPRVARENLRESMRLLNESVVELRTAARQAGRTSEQARAASGVARQTDAAVERQTRALLDEADTLSAQATQAVDDLARDLDPAMSGLTRTPRSVERAQALADRALRTAQRVEERLAEQATRVGERAAGATDRAAMAGDLERAAAGGVQDATQGVRAAQRGVQQAERTTARLTNDIDSYDAVVTELEREITRLERAAQAPRTRADLAGQGVEMLRDDLLELKDRYADVKRAYDATSTQDFVQSSSLPGRYFPSAEAAQIDELMRPAKDNVLTRFMEGWRSQVLAGDVGPLTGIQGIVAAASGRAGTTRAVAGAFADAAKGIARGEPGALLRPYTQETMELFIRENAALVQDYAFYTGRNVGGRLPAEIGQGGALAKIPGFVDANEGMFNVVTRRQIEMFRRVRDDLVKAGYSAEEASAAAADLSNKVLPLTTPARLGQSAAKAQEERFLPTSLGFIRQPLALTEEAFTTLGRLASGQSVTPRQKLALSIYGQMIGNLMVASIATAAINAQARGGDVTEAIQSALDPDSRSFMAVSVGAQTIPLANVFRSPLRVGIGTVRNILNPAVERVTGRDISQDAGASPVNYATARIGPPVRAALETATELTAAPWNRKYQGDNDVLRLLSAAGIALGGALPIPAAGIGEEVLKQRKAGELDPMRIAQVASAETAGLSLIPEEPTGTLDVTAEREHGVPFEELTPREQSAILTADPSLAKASETVRREQVTEQLDEAGFTKIAPETWTAVRSLHDDIAGDYEAYRDQKMPALVEIAREQGDPDPEAAAARMFGRLEPVRQYRDLLASRRKAWALENSKNGLAQLAVDYNFLASNEDIRRILTAVEPVR